MLVSENESTIARSAMTTGSWRAGSTAYGFGLFSENLTYEDFATMFHGDNERIDTESLRLTTEMWEALVREFCG